jgi:flagellar hook-length control protein FliK
MDATVRAENPEAREALLRDLPALREALASNGIVLSSFDVSLSGHGSSAEQQAPRQAAGWETGQGHRPRRESEQDASNPGFRPDRGTSRADSAGAAGGHWIA